MSVGTPTGVRLRPLGTSAKGVRAYLTGVASSVNMTLGKEFERAFEHVDIIAMPTTPIKPEELPVPDAPYDEVVNKALFNPVTACTVDLTHHPAITVPCGRS